jgi:hypothetical protein
MNDKQPTGGCMCGAVRYELQDDSTWNVHCHCASCRQHTGAPVAAFAVSSRPTKFVGHQAIGRCTNLRQADSERFAWIVVLP